MLYWLLYGPEGPLLDVPGIWLLKFISFRAAAAAVTAFLLALTLGRIVIPRLAMAGMRESTDKSPAELLRELHAGKQGTPTMGGTFLIGSLLISGAVWLRFDRFNDYSWIALFTIAWFAAVGFADDWIKLRTERKGLRGRIKQRLLTAGALLSGLALVWMGLGGDDGPSLWLPFTTEPLVEFGTGWLGVAGFALLAVLVLTGSANAVNLTDGMDGLATGCVLTASLAYCGISYFVGNSELASYLRVEHVPGAGEMVVLLAGLIGACFGFLWFNAAPALVFMGDVGSLALGGALGFVALVSRTEFALVVVGGIFVAEAVSVILQVVSFRLFGGRRIFRCAPLHHHFEYGKMPETRVVVRFWIVSAMLALCSLALFKVR
ncbi:MAG: phospho-N-acetylmuramoyl-pentapeptide-transferase [Planctomycetota bacterium]